IRNQRSLGVMMLDIDSFKGFNDRFGHAAGDALLRELGVLLQSHIRGEDIACRYGGEEFTLILPQSGPENTKQRAEQLLRHAGNLQVLHGGQALGRITVSIGVSAFPQHGASADVLLRAADAALYRAKRESGDRVVAAS